MSKEQLTKKEEIVLDGKRTWGGSRYKEIVTNPRKSAAEEKFKETYGRYPDTRELNFVKANMSAKFKPSEAAKEIMEFEKETKPILSSKTYQ